MSLTKTADKYRPVFQRYLQGALRQSLSQVQEHQYKISEDARVQACHVLTLTLDIDALWEQASQLLIALSPKMEISGQWDIWIPFLKKGIAISRQVGDESAEAQLCLELGTIMRRQYSYAEAHKLLTKARYLHEKLSSPTGVALCLNQLALKTMVQREYPQTIELAEKALGLLEAEEPEAANSYFILGTIRRQREELETARHSFERAIELRSKQGNYSKLAANLVGMSIVDQKLGNFEVEREHLTKAIDLLDESGDILALADVQNNLGISYLRSDDFAKALDLFRGAASIYRKVGNVGNLAGVYTNLGIACTNLGNWKLAGESLRASLAIYRQLTDIPMEVNATIELARLYQLKGNAHKAQSNLDAASLLLNEVIEPYRSAELANEIAAIANLIISDTAESIPVSG